MQAWVVEMEQCRRDADALANDDARKAAQQSYQQDLNRLARESGLDIRVCHFPPGTSKWNKIEHRLI